MKKRGVSPLIATVLLVGIAVTLAVVLSTFIQELSKKETEEAEKELFLSQICMKEVDIDYRSFCFYNEVQNPSDPGFYNAKIKIEVRNNGEVPIEQFSFKTLGKETRVFAPAAGLDAYDTVTFDPPSDNYYGVLKDTEDTPGDTTDDSIYNIEILVKKEIDYNGVSGNCDDDKIPINYIQHCPP